MRQFYKLHFGVKIALAVFFLLAASIAVSAQTINCGGIGGTIRSQEVVIPQRGGGTLNAKIFAPDATLQTAPCPLITMLPGGGAEISSVEWAATRLAANGYVVIITKPQTGGSLNDYNTAARSGIDFLQSAASPYLSGTNTDLVGATGWSLGSRILMRTQEEDLRVAAVVGWDNIAVSETGDTGSPACTNTPGTLRTPRVPTLGQASEACNDGRDADVKKTAFNRWREFGKPAFQLVFHNSNHFWWSTNGSGEARWNAAHYYTQAWFDRWLKRDLTATTRLMARTVNGTALEDLFSQIFRSGAFFDGYNCDDLRTSCQRPAGQPVTVGGRVTNSSGRPIAGARVILYGESGAPRYSQTNAFGFYRFINVLTNNGYYVSASAKNRRFPQPDLYLNLTNGVTDANFVAAP